MSRSLRHPGRFFVAGILLIGLSAAGDLRAQVPPAADDFEQGPAFSGPVLPAGTSGTDRVGEVDWLTVIFALGFVLVILAGGAFLLRRYVPGGRHLVPSPAIQVLGRRPISAQATVYLVEIGRSILRLGVGSQGIVYLGEIRDPDEIAQVRAENESDHAHSMRRTFSDLLARNMKEPPPPPEKESRVRIEQELDHVRKVIDGWKEK